MFQTIKTEHEKPTPEAVVCGGILTQEQRDILTRDGFIIVEEKNGKVIVRHVDPTLIERPLLKKEDIQKLLYATTTEMMQGPICRRKYEGKPAAWREKADKRRKARVAQ